MLKHVDEEDRQIFQRSQNTTFDDIIPQNRRNATFANIPNRGLTVINESGLYSLTFSSKHPSTKKFRRWVTGTVLPAIRKTGGYIHGEERMTSDELKKATERVLNAKLGQKLNEKMDSQEMDLPTFVRMVCDGERVSWNPAQLMEKRLWRYANACCRNDIQAARRDLYNNLNEYCDICLWDRRRDAQKLDHEKGLRPMYAFLSVREESLAILFAMAMCAYNGAAIGDLIRMYC